MLNQLGFVGTTEECVKRLKQERGVGALLHSVNVT